MRRREIHVVPTVLVAIIVVVSIFIGANLDILTDAPTITVVPTVASLTPYGTPDTYATMDARLAALEASPMPSPTPTNPPINRSEMMAMGAIYGVPPTPTETPNPALDMCEFAKYGDVCYPFASPTPEPPPTQVPPTPTATPVPECRPDMYQSEISNDHVCRKVLHVNPWG